MYIRLSDEAGMEGGGMGGGGGGDGRQKGPGVEYGRVPMHGTISGRYHHHHHHRHHHLSLNRQGRWGTTDDFTTSLLLFFPVLHCPLGLAELQACPFPGVVFPPLPMSALSSSPFHCALQDGFGQT